MKLPESTEWVLHCATTLALLEPGSVVAAGRLARYFDVPPAYLAKQLQGLVRAGVFGATTGPRGGFRLARRPEEITLLELVEAVDGASAPYVCNEIRQRGEGAARPEECKQMCGIAAKMAAAHRAWRDNLSATTLADLRELVPRKAAARTRSILSTRP